MNATTTRTAKSAVLSFIDFGRVIGAGDAKLESTMLALRTQYAKCKSADKQAQMKHDFTVGYIMAREGMTQRGAETIATLAKSKDQSDEGKKVVDAAWKKFEYWIAQSGVKAQGKGNAAARISTKDLTDEDRKQMIRALPLLGFNRGANAKDLEAAAQYFAAFAREVARGEKKAKTK